jgi:hypothetical protein
MRQFIHRYLAPKTLEQSIGVVMLITAALMIARPYAAGIDNLYMYYGISISPRFYGAALALCGGVFILRKRVGRRTFALLYLPVPVYTLCLILNFARNPMVGPIASAALLALSIAIPWFYSSRASRREQEDA